MEIRFGFSAYLSMAFKTRWSSMSAKNGVGLTAFTTLTALTAKVAHDCASIPCHYPFVRNAAKLNPDANELPAVLRDSQANAQVRPTAGASANTSFSKTIERLHELRMRDEKLQGEEELNRICAFYGMSKEEAQCAFSPSELKRLEYISVLYAPSIMTGQTTLSAKQNVRAFMIDGMGSLDVSELKYALLMKVGAAHKCTPDD